MNFDTRAISISLVILATIGVFYVLVVGKAFLVPLAVALMIWYVINAMSRSYVKLIPWVKQPNWLSMTLAIFSIGLFIALTVDLVQNNVANVQQSIPKYRDNFNALSTKVGEMLPTQALENLPELSDLLQGIEFAPLLTTFTDNVVAMISNVTLVLIYVAFMLAEQGTFRKKISTIFPDQANRGSVMSILVHAQEDIQTYLWIKSLTSTLTGLISYFVLRMVDVDFAAFWAFSIFMLNFIPTVGSIIATLFPAMLALIQFDTLIPFFVVLIGVGSIQLIVGNVLEPKLMGNTLNVSPFVVMMSLTLWGSIWGIAGMFLSVPITVMMLIVFAHFDRTRYIAVLLSGDGSLKFAKQVEKTLIEIKAEDGEDREENEK